MINVSIILNKNEGVIMKDKFDKILTRVSGLNDEEVILSWVNMVMEQ